MNTPHSTDFQVLTAKSAHVDQGATNPHDSSEHREIELRVLSSEELDATAGAFWSLYLQRYNWKMGWGNLY